MNYNSGIQKISFCSEPLDIPLLAGNRWLDNIIVMRCGKWPFCPRDYCSSLTKSLISVLTMLEIHANIFAPSVDNVLRVWTINCYTKSRVAGYLYEMHLVL